MRHEGMKLQTVTENKTPQNKANLLKNFNIQLTRSLHKLQCSDVNGVLGQDIS